MKKKNEILLFSAPIVLILVIITTYFSLTKYIYGLYALPEGKFLTESTSPNGEYTVKTYKCIGNVESDVSIRGELINNKTNKKRNIYWDHKIYNANVIWDTDNSVIINAHKINLQNGKYNWRVDKY
ncbi:DUF5412 family protein [Clostridium sp.]|uniref:DUF5412 family protein n=1 Tax=Clostridium sp. TaxID=1506 RepID=UPI0039960B35